MARDGMWLGPLRASVEDAGSSPRLAIFERIVIGLPDIDDTHLGKTLLVVLSLAN